MKALIHAFLLAAVAAAMLPAGAHAAAAMYCGTEIVRTGMSKFEVADKCGLPNMRDLSALNTFGVAVRPLFRSTTTPVEVWHYNCGEGRFSKDLYFEGPELVLIEDNKQYGAGPRRCD